MYEMRKLQEDLARAMFHGFILQPGFWYGYDADGFPVATSTWVQNGELAMYIKQKGLWKREWKDLKTNKMNLPLPLVQELQRVGF